MWGPSGVGGRHRHDKSTLVSSVSIVVPRFCYLVYVQQICTWHAYIVFQPSSPTCNRSWQTTTMTYLAILLLIYHARAWEGERLHIIHVVHIMTYIILLPTYFHIRRIDHCICAYPYVVSSTICVYVCHWPRMKPWLGSTPPGNHNFFLKHTFWSKTRFGPLLRVFGRLVVSKINFEHFF